MRSIRNITSLFILFVLLTPVSGSAQQFTRNLLCQKQEQYVPTGFVGFPRLAIRRSGPYIGLQNGKYFVPEFGYEMQWNQARLRKPRTHAAHMGFNYNFRYNILGYDAGYWYKVGRLDLTYGANLAFRTNFDDNAFGIAPVIGFKFWQLHLQTGYYFLTRPAKDFETNTFFVSLRYVFINNRDWKLKRQKKKEKG